MTQVQVWQRSSSRVGVDSFGHCFSQSVLAIWKVGLSLLKLMRSAYFDDFLCSARQSESRHVDFCVDAIFSPLGWRISKHKLIAFDSLCKNLGGQVRPQTIWRSAVLSNTEDRVEELAKDISDILTSKLLTRAAGERLRGRVPFASSQVFGRKSHAQVPCRHFSAPPRKHSSENKCFPGRGIAYIC